MKKALLELIEERLVLLDGAMGSLLLSAGLSGGEPPERWNVTHPGKILEIHKAYFSAGSDIVLTNTFGGTRAKLSRKNDENNLEKYNTRAVEIARSVCPQKAYVAGDIGPTGDFLPPVGNATVEKFQANFQEQARILSNAGVDLFFIETMSDIREAEAAIKAAKGVSNLPLFVSMTYQKTKRGFFTIMGDSVEKCVKRLEDLNVHALGANCTVGSSEMVDLIPLLEQLTDMPIIAKPNAGQPRLQQGKTVYTTTPEEFTRDIKKMVEAGASIVGGCCGTNPGFIEKMAVNLRE
ncbi:MAG: hypothetical protein GF308_04275 [Candidatus Heimdallarchaeota archaeon]|nr:hypothetical protein [Candidatus Heimdallarchaeota archaeon]